MAAASAMSQRPALPTQRRRDLKRGLRAEGGRGTQRLTYLNPYKVFPSCSMTSQDLPEILPRRLKTAESREKFIKSQIISPCQRTASSGPDNPPVPEFGVTSPTPGCKSAGRTPRQCPAGCEGLGFTPGEFISAFKMDLSTEDQQGGGGGPRQLSRAHARGCGEREEDTEVCPGRPSVLRAEQRK